MNIDTPNLQLSERNNEISLKGVHKFIKSEWKIITIAGIIGICISIGYLAIAPKKFQATAQVALAKIGTTNKDKWNASVNVEEVPSLLMRIYSPNSIDLDTLHACGIESAQDGAVAISNIVFITPIKGVDGAINLKIINSTQEQAKACADAIFAFIKITQQQLIDPYLELANDKLNENELRMRTLNAEVSRAENFGGLTGAAYLSNRDEIRFLLEESSQLKTLIKSSKYHSAHLVAPIYVNSQPIEPRRKVVLQFGLLGGLFMGVLISLARQIFSSLSKA